LLKSNLLTILQARSHLSSKGAWLILDCADLLTLPALHTPRRVLCPSSPAQPLSRRDAPFSTSEHCQTELVRPGARIIDLGDGMKPISCVPRSASRKTTRRPIPSFQACLYPFSWAWAD